MSPIAQKNSLTVIIPVYNELECLSRLQEQLNRFLRLTPFETKILFVDDGSTDGSGGILQGMCQTNASYELISLETNAGLSAALKAGIDHCRTSLIGYMDADLQTLPEDFLTLLPFMAEYDMVNGIRQQRHDTVVKRLTSKIANACRNLMIHDGIADTCCPLKVMKASHARNIPFFNGMHRFLPALIQLQGGSVKQVPVRHFPRYAGTAKYHLGNRLVGPFFDTLAVIWMKRRFIHYRVLPKT